MFSKTSGAQEKIQILILNFQRKGNVVEFQLSVVKAKKKFANKRKGSDLFKIDAYIISSSLNATWCLIREKQHGDIQAFVSNLGSLCYPL